MEQVHLAQSELKALEPLQDHDSVDFFPSFFPAPVSCLSFACSVSPCISLHIFYCCQHDNCPVSVGPTWHSFACLFLFLPFCLSLTRCLCMTCQLRIELHESEQHTRVVRFRWFNLAVSLSCKHSNPGQDTQAQKILEGSSRVREEVDIQSHVSALFTEEDRAANCPQDFTFSRHNSCYHISTEMVTWEEAEDRCQQLGAHLVAIESKAEQKYLLRNIRKLPGI